MEIEHPDINHARVTGYSYEEFKMMMEKKLEESVEFAKDFYGTPLKDHDNMYAITSEGHVVSACNLQRYLEEELKFELNYYMED